MEKAVLNKLRKQQHNQSGLGNQVGAKTAALEPFIQQTGRAV